MNFKQLREADLSKAQIKKVHDKADEMPKSDFIKRYGKDGDSVRFATATNIVKKQLGIGEGRIMGISRLNPSYKEGEKAAEKGIKYDKNPYSQSTPGFKRLNWSSGHNAFRAAQLSKAGKPNYGARGQFEELDKEDEKSIGDVIKGLKKAVKSHQGQVKSLTKDIKDEVEEGGPGSGPQVDVKQKKKDKADTQRLLDRQKRLQSIGKRNEEVVTEAVSDAYVKQIARMTDNNDHFGARIELARMMRDKELMQMYDSLEKMHRMNLGGNDALTLRSKLDKNLKFRLTQKVKKDADRLMGAL